MFVCEKEKNEVEIKEQKPQINSFYTIFVYFERFIQIQATETSYFDVHETENRTADCDNNHSHKKRSEADRHRCSQGRVGAHLVLKLGVDEAVSQLAQGRAQAITVVVGVGAIELSAVITYRLWLGLRLNFSGTFLGN